MKVKYRVLPVASTLVIALGSSWFSGWAAPRLLAQEQKEVPAISEAVTRLDGASSRVLASLGSRDRYRVDVTQKWTLDGDLASSGANRYVLTAWHGGAFSLAIRPEGDGTQTLRCFSDGAMLTRILERPGGVIYSQDPGNLSNLLGDVMTETCLRESGIDLLFRESPDSYLMTMASQVEFVGSEEVDGVQAEHFRFTWGGDPTQRKDLWFVLDSEPRLVKLVATREFTTGEKEQHTLRVETSLRWEGGEQVPQQPGALQIPPDSKKVRDLYGYLLEGRTGELVGKAVPTVSVDLLNGGKWDLSQHRGKELVVIYFFSTWAAPTRADMPVILEFIDKFEPQGVAFYAVDVGEDLETVRAFAQSQGYSHPVVVDSKREVANAFGVTSLPSVVLVGKDGMVKAAHVGSTPEVRAFVRSEVEQTLGIQSEEQ